MASEQESVWTEECEKLLSEWSEKSSCFRWLHARCELKYRRRYYLFSIPVIILSTLTGTANFGMDSYGRNVRRKFFLCVGICDSYA